MTLSKYNSKRNFTITSEPLAKLKLTKTKRFVVQLHKARSKHYDFRLEHNGVLLSWAVPKGLSPNPKIKRLAVMVENHPVDYINFKGIIPKGNYGAGSVEIYDTGTYQEINDFNVGLKKGHLKFILWGKKLKGEWSLVRTNNNWLIIKNTDIYAQTNTQIKKNKLPFKSIQAELATLTTTIPTGKDWLFEIKYDGFRIISFVENRKAQLYTRNHKNFTYQLRNIATALEQINEENFVLDGEVVTFDQNGRTSFSLLQNSLKTSKNNLFFIVFDLLALNGEDFRDKPLSFRKKKLELLLAKTPDNIMYSNHINGHGQECFEMAKNNNLEGIVAKKSTSKYTGKRSVNWLKIKCYLRQEFVIIGFTTTHKNPDLSALVIGVYKDKHLVCMGKVGTGFTANQRKSLRTKLDTLIQKKHNKILCLTIKNIQHVRPKLVAEIQYTELTKEGFLRQPSFLGLRNDKNPKDIKLEQNHENF